MTNVAALQRAFPAVQSPNMRRAEAVSGFARLSAMVFGSPSAARANGSARASVLPRALRTDAWYARRMKTPVFEIDRRGTRASERLPRIWVSEAAYDERTGAYVGREFVGVYPNGADGGGWHALDLAERYYGEALGLEGPSADALRTECFRAAEILLLHAAARGNAEACFRLAELYEGDLCRGRYWKGALECRARHAADMPARQRAAVWLARAVSLGHAPACCKLGDVLAGGEACLQDNRRAYVLYQRAYSLLSQRGCQDEAWAGTAALRIAQCHELGRGCSQSFEEARSWYLEASSRLGSCVSQGEWKSKRDLHQTRLGVRRMDQEIAGCY